MSYTCHTHGIRMAYTWHTRVIHTSYTRHVHVIHMSCTCHTHVIHMSFTCRTHVIHMSYTVMHTSYTCHAHFGHMSHTCQTHVIHMSCTCHTHVIHMSYTCHTHVIHMSCTCHAHVQHMSCTCRTHVQHMSCTCHTHVVYMSYTCHAHAIHMSYTCQTHVMHMPFACHTHGQSGGARSFIANSVQGHAPPTNWIPGHAGAAMPLRDEVMGPGPWDVGWSATANRPHPLEEGGARWRTRSSDRAVNTQDDDWHRRLEERQAAVSAVQETESHRALWRKLRTLEAWGGHPCESAFPKPLDCTDRIMSKRSWEVDFFAYRVAIR